MQLIRAGQFGASHATTRLQQLMEDSRDVRYSTWSNDKVKTHFLAPWLYNCEMALSILLKISAEFVEVDWNNVLKTSTTPEQRDKKVQKDSIAKPARCLNSLGRGLFNIQVLLLEND